jgi:hypothetical protein
MGSRSACLATSVIHLSLQLLLPNRLLYAVRCSAFRSGVVRLHFSSVSMDYPQSGV